MIIAIDCGGTKTKILACENENIIFNKTIQGFGFAADDENTPVPELADCIKTIPGYINAEKIVVNLGGKNCGQIKNTLKAVFPHGEIDIYRESSGIIGNYMRKRLNADVIVFAGTGAIALGGNDEGYFVADGWGRDIGDMGSGYYIGLESIRLALTALEDGEITPLVAEITGERQAFPLVQTPDGLVDKRDEVRKRILPLDRRKIAGIARITAKHARMGDKLAIEVYKMAGRELAQTVIRVLKKIDKTNNATIAVAGGIASGKELWKESFEDMLKTYSYNFRLIFPEVDFAMGTLMYAQEREDNKL